MMETLENTETSHCDVIDLFPHPPVPPKTCVFWRGEWGPSPEQGREGSLPPGPQPCKSWIGLLTQHPVTSIRAVVWGARPGARLPLSSQPSETSCCRHPCFSDEDTEAQEHSLSKILHHLVSALVAVSSLASPGEAFPGLC